ncbi:hypothetical protein [Persephonella sp. KM09-Lau-8]|uniref:hypothetical protein n=1 Tax=Persephonella sp. KM09-Lau-8 TaxID=1158345 RepID=UPI000498061E|nr:hypothetical protein [Persephonella sp. KM09-Lau-8]
MNLYQLMQKYYPKDTEKIKEALPKMVEFAKEVEVIPWNEEFQVADKNPEYIDQINLLEMMLKSELITEEEFKKEIRKIPYASKTLGTALIQEKKVSFRDKIPPIGVMFHELGHVFFKASDLEWNETYGGGEIYAKISINKIKKITEEQIADFMRIYRLIYMVPSEKIEEVSWLIGKEIKKEIGESFPEHPLSMMIMAGSIPTIEFEKGKEDFYNAYPPQKLDEKLKNNKVIIKPKYLKSALLQFISTYMQDGYIYGDPFFIQYANAFFKNIKQIKLKLIKTLNPKINNDMNLDKKTQSPIKTDFIIATGFDPEEITNLITEHLPVDREEIEIGMLSGLKTVKFTKEAEERIKVYLKDKKPKLPKKLEKILKESNIL